MVELGSGSNELTHPRFFFEFHFRACWITESYVHFTVMNLYTIPDLVLSSFSPLPSKGPPHTWLGVAELCVKYRDG